MKKFFITILKIFFSAVIFCSLVFLILYFCGDKIFTFYADKLYENKDYEKAYSIYETLFACKPQELSLETKAVKCLVKMPLTYSVQNKLLEIAQKDDNSEAEKLATKCLLMLRTKISQKFGSNYIENALRDTTVMRWSKKSFPLKYYIQPSSEIPNYYIPETIGAFKDWERESENFLTFKQVNNPANADIIIKFEGSADKNLAPSQEYKAAVTSNVLENDKILKRMDIKCLIKSHTNKFFTPKQIKTLMTHEIGHAIGICGHPDERESIMYYSLDNYYDYYADRIDSCLSEKDIATVKLLYSLAPDVTDKNYDTAHKEKFISAAALVSPLDEKNEKLIKKAKQLLNDNPDDMNYALSLADAYNSSGKYKESLALMTLLTQKTTDKSLLNILYYNIANNYIGLKDYENAINTAKKALLYSKNLDNYNLIAYIKYLQNDLNGAEADYKTILSKNPKYINAAIGLTDVYIKKKDLLSARKVLKTLLQYDPQALDDKNLSLYKIYTVF